MEPPSSSLSPQSDSSVFFRVRDLDFLDRGPFSFSLEQGECVGLTGQSGIGKSQLLRALADLIPSDGNITLEGMARESYPAPEWRKLVTIAVAESSWWFDNVGDHFSGEKKSGQLAAQVVRLGFPVDVLTWEVHRLSTGEKQRLGLLRSLQNKPRVLLLDEPTSALDHHHTMIVETFIAEFCRDEGMAVLWVSHDTEQIKRVARRELHMEKNCLRETVFM